MDICINLGFQMSIIYKYKTDFFGLTESLFFEIQSENEEFIREYVDTFLSIFARIDENDSSKAMLECLQKNTPETRGNIDELVNKYSVMQPGLNKIAAYFRKLKENEHFIFIPNIELGLNKRLELYDLLRALETGENIETTNEKTKNLFAHLIDRYDIRAYGPKRMCIGVANKDKRVCRFCNRTSKEVPFKNRSHAISEALGNKTLILHDECDQCNYKFSQAIEPDIILYLSLYRTMFDVKGKDGSKKFVGKNFKIENSDGVVVTMHGKRHRPFQNGNYNLTLEASSMLNVQNIYKCLCKYFISVIDAEYLPIFTKTIEWINGDFKVDHLPKIGELTSHHSFSKQPKIVTYIRKDGNRSTPFAVGEFYFTCKVFAFTVPLFSQDEMNFVDPKEFNAFWRTFKHYDKSKGWAFNDFSFDKKKEYSLDLNFKVKGD